MYVYIQIWHYSQSIILQPTFPLNNISWASCQISISRSTSCFFNATEYCFMDPLKQVLLFSCLKIQIVASSVCYWKPRGSGHPCNYLIKMLIQDFCRVVSFRASQVVLGVKNPPDNAEDIRNVGSVPGRGRSPGEGHGNPLQYSCPENPMDIGAWHVTIHRVSKSRTQLKQLNTTHIVYFKWIYLIKESNVLIFDS